MLGEGGADRDGMKGVSLSEGRVGTLLGGPLDEFLASHLDRTRTSSRHLVFTSLA